EPVLSWRLLEDFFEPYQSAGIYPIARLPHLAYAVMDLKMQFYFVTRVSGGTWNALLSGTEFSLDDDPTSRPGQYFQHLYLMQAGIGQTRILWDRLMGFVYWLEEGRETPGKSIRSAFFKRLPEWSPRWDVLDEWEARIDKYDKRFRTAEFHKSSTLRASIFSEAINPNEIIALIEPVMNGFWDVLKGNITGTPTGVMALGRQVDPAFDNVDDPGRPAAGSPEPRT
ncbi:hypothetical protein ACFXON_24790, partial [Bacillus subtilis]